MQYTRRLALLCAALSLAQCWAEPSWIWSKRNAGDGDKIIAKTEFQVKGEIKAAQLWLTCDNGADASINNKPALKNPDWSQPTVAQVKDFLRKGRNEIVVDARNQGGMAGLIAKLTIELADGTKQVIETGADWQVAASGTSDFKPAMVLGKHGVEPWGDVLGAKPGKGGGATDPADITAPAGFKVELVYTVPKGEQGSWVSMTVDPQGRLITGDQRGGLFRVTPSAISGAAETKVEALGANVGGAHGLLWAFDSLYVMVNEKENKGIHRLRDKDNDGTFEESAYISKIEGGGEHGTHQFALTPDGKGILFCNGNHTRLPENLARMRMADAWGEDHVLPRMPDANGHARGIMAPGGGIFRMDPDASNIELISGGYRNQYDFGVDPNGEIFTYDADMEWDLGSPWYRPTRISHATSGSDHGWRNGSGKWPTYYADSLPPAVNIGPGSPTGVVFGYGAKFPAKYQRALFANDWTYGTMYAIHLEPDGGSFHGVKEEFVFGRPLPLTDVVINPKDGAMYFAIGGRGTQSAVYRVTYAGAESTAPAAPLPQTAEIKLRHQLEKLHDAGTGADAVDQAWPHLGHADRFVRYAARVAVERQPASAWAEKALSETRPQAVIEAMIALARVGRDKAYQPRIFAALGKLPFKTLPVDQQLGAVRAYQLALTRLGKPDADACARLAAALDPLYPAAHADVNQELSQVLIAIDSPSAVAKTMNLVATAKDDSGKVASDELLERNAGYGRAAVSVHTSRPNTRQIAYMFSLRNARVGWTPELRKAYFSWFPRARQWQGGNSFKGFIENTRKEALANFAPEAEKAELDALSQKAVTVAGKAVTPPEGPGKAYTVDDVEALAKAGLKGRSFEKGKNHYSAIMCATCHHFAGEGGNVGPDLTGSGNRYSIRDLAENIIDPSKVVSDQYPTHELHLKDGSLVIGRVVGEENGRYVVMSNPFAPELLSQVPVADVKEKKVMATSIMPPSLINSLNEQELLDLIAYLMSGGNPQDKMFAK